MQSWGERSGGDCGAWETQEKGSQGRRALTVSGRCQAPLGFWGSGMVPAGPSRTPGPSRQDGQSPWLIRNCFGEVRGGWGGAEPPLPEQR